MQIDTQNTKEVPGPTYCTIMLTFLIFPLQYVLYSVFDIFIIQSWVKFHSRIEHLTTV